MYYSNLDLHLKLILTWASERFLQVPPPPPFAMVGRLQRSDSDLLLGTFLPSIHH
ncbi:hypothetical protein A2U01_0081383, partial [Trifolium medium]|nr:hypothetical protein [Trifolium medium]